VLSLLLESAGAAENSLEHVLVRNDAAIDLVLC